MMNQHKETKTSSREAAYLACLEFEREGLFLNSSLQKWSLNQHPSPQDFRLAQEIAYGCCRMQLTLEEIAVQLAQSKLVLKRKERLLLHSALYQYFFLEKIPLYALADQTIEIAKIYCHSHFVKFLNVLLRKLPSSSIRLPHGYSAEELSVSHSYPIGYIRALLGEYGTDLAVKILKAGNSPGILMARKRGGLDFTEMRLFSGEEIAEMASSKEYYIQNSTPVQLISFLAEKLEPPKTILDLCSAPGGKLICCHDLFPQACLTDNDLTTQKIAILKENLDKYEIPATFFCGPGQDFKAGDGELYDLILLDVPCSNTGVLNKRPEARWRLSREQGIELVQLQKSLLKRAKDLLSPRGEIWYLTCSILHKENEGVVQEMAKDLGLKIKKMKKILPDTHGADGGFCCALIQS